MCNYGGGSLHIAVHGSSDLMLKTLNLSKLCNRDLQTPTEYCCQVTESVQLTLGQLVMKNDIWKIEGRASSRDFYLAGNGAKVPRSGRSRIARNCSIRASTFPVGKM